MDKPLLQPNTNPIVARPDVRLGAAQRDYGLLALLTLVLIVVSGLPFFYASTLPAGDRQFMGIVADVPDTAQYFAWQRAHQQALIVSNWMTPEPNAPAFFNTLWLVLGWLSAWTGMSR